MQTTDLNALTQNTAADSDETAALGREELALAGTPIPPSAARSVGHVAFHAASSSEFYISLGGVYRANWFDDMVPFTLTPFPGGAAGYRPAQYVCTVNDALFARPAAESLPAEVVAAIRKMSGL